MAQFRVKTGVHYDPDPDVKRDPDNPAGKPKNKMFKQGEIVESNRPLDELYENKFEKLVPGVNAPWIVSAERKKQVQEIIDGGKMEEEDRKFLETLTDEQFSHVTRRMDGPRRPKQEEAPEEAKSAEPAEPERKGVESKLGQDVTDEFPQATKSGLRVLRTPAGKHHVVKTSDPNKPLNKQALDRQKVDEFVVQHNKDEE